MIIIILWSPTFFQNVTYGVRFLEQCQITSVHCMRTRIRSCINKDSLQSWTMEYETKTQMTETHVQVTYTCYFLSVLFAFVMLTEKVVGGNVICWIRWNLHKHLPRQIFDGIQYTYAPFLVCWNLLESRFQWFAVHLFKTTIGSSSCYETCSGVLCLCYGSTPSSEGTTSGGVVCFHRHDCLLGFPCINGKTFYPHLPFCLRWCIWYTL